MATTSIWKVEGWLGKVLAYAENPEKTEVCACAGAPPGGLEDALGYIANPEKTEQQLFVTGINCLSATARDEMNATKRQFDKPGGIVAFHGYQSFAPGETDPKTAHEIGVSLARELWGERFEVVVATHLDKEHLHNHFVINSVSFADGRRFHRDNACYAAMRDMSDRLCQERGLSTIESPEPGRARHYGEWRAEREGRQTWRGLVKADVDEAIVKAMTDKQFFANLCAIGYDIKYGKDISVRPPGKERFVRLARNFGDDYTYESIAKRILENHRHELPIPKPKRTQKATRRTTPALPKGTLIGLYRHYRYLFERSSHRSSSNARMHFLLREDIQALDQITREFDLLSREGIKTVPELKAYELNLTKRIDTLVTERKKIHTQIRRDPETPDKEAKEHRIKDINDKLKQYRREVRLCRSIETRALALPARIETIKRADEPETTDKEVKEWTHQTKQPSR